MQKVKNVEQLVFEWTPKDANQAVAFEVARGYGLITGRKVELWFTVKYPTILRPEYAQIDGWDKVLNPFENMNAPGVVSATSVPSTAKVIANECTALVDRIAIRSNGKVMNLADIQDQYIIGNISWLIV